MKAPTSKAAQRALKGSLEDGIRIVMEDLLGRAQREVPRDEGTLAGSGEADVNVIGDRIYGRVSFSTPYAKRQHEELTWEHPKGGKAKYLEDPLTANADRYEKVIGLVAKERLKRGR